MLSVPRLLHGVAAAVYAPRTALPQIRMLLLPHLPRCTTLPSTLALAPDHIML